MVYDPASQAAAVNYATGPGKSLSGSQRYRNELNDRRNQINTYEGLDPYLLDIINGRTAYAEQSDPETLLRRYGTVYNARQGDERSQDAASYVQQIYGGSDQTNQYAYDTFRSVFGREPSQTEFAQVLPIFGGAEGRQRGAAYVSKMFDEYKQSPEFLKTQAGQYSDELAPIYQELLGRDARQDEVDYYGQQLAGGRSEYEIRQLLQQLPEYRTAEDQKFRTGLASELEGYDTSFFDKAKENVISRSRRQGGGVSTSSALDFALTNLMGDIAEKRGGYLANLSAQQYGGNKDAAREDYRTSMNRYFEDQDYNQRRNDSDREYYRSRSDEDRDYERQFNDYMTFQDRNKSRGSWVNSALGGAGALAPLGGWGAAAGGAAGLWSHLNY